MTFSCLAIATGAEAQTTWLGAQLAVPVPVNDVGDAQPGIVAGVTINHMEGPHTGVGLDLSYHYWPASAEYRAAFDRYLRTSRFEAIDSPTWAFSALQLTAHVRLEAPKIGRHGAWLQIGGGVYRINRNLEEPNWDIAYITPVVEEGNIAVVPGGYGSVGFDFPTSTHVVLGLDASFHYLKAEDDQLPDFSALTFGAHVLFGW